ncbi:MAG: archease [bacterium]|nr:archease [bacterium]
MTKKTEIIDHSADIGLKITGDTIEEFFEAAAEGMFSIILDPGSMQHDTTIKISLSEPDYDDLLLEWLRELLFLFETKKLVLSKYKISITVNESNAKNLTAECSGELFDKNKHQFNTEIKNVTYHRLKVEKHFNKWEGEVIFDL